MFRRPPQFIGDSPFDAVATPQREAAQSLPWVDLFPWNGSANPYGQIWNTDGGNVAFTIERPIYGLALTGLLGPGMALLLAPVRKRDALTAFLAKYGGSNDELWFALGGGGTAAAFGAADLTLLRPGESIAWREPVSGIVALPISPYSPSEPARPGPNTGYGARPAPVVRVFTAPDVAPHRVGYTPIATLEHREAVDTAAPSSSSDGLLVGLGTTHVTIALRDNVGIDIAATYAAGRIQGAETGSYEVWWLLPCGLWVHNPADDFDAAGRGEASASHDVEAYSVPRSALRVYVRQISGSNFYWSCLCADGNTGANGQ